jgi:hypothetical protein
MLVPLTDAGGKFCFALFEFHFQWGKKNYSLIWQETPLKNFGSVSALRCSSDWQKATGAGYSRAYWPSGQVGLELWKHLHWVSSWMTGFGQNRGNLLCYCKKEKEMNLSSCVADSMILSFDSAGQTLGAGTNSSPTVIFSALNNSHICSEA